jgi:hypothetical protein
VRAQVVAVLCTRGSCRIRVPNSGRQPFGPAGPNAASDSSGARMGLVAGGTSKGSATCVRALTTVRLAQGKDDAQGVRRVCEPLGSEVSGGSGSYCQECFRWRTVVTDRCPYGICRSDDVCSGPSAMAPPHVWRRRWKKKTIRSRSSVVGLGSPPR